MDGQCLERQLSTGKPDLELFFFFQSRINKKRFKKLLTKPG